MQIKVPAVFMRGGTSKALFLKASDLRAYPAPVQERIILAALGSPDPYGLQIDGLGGGSSSTSKVAIIARAENDDADVLFTFGQVGVTTPTVEFLGTCGNISAAVGPFAVDEGLVPVREPVTLVRIKSVNTGQRYVAHVPVRAGKAAVDGDFAIDGVPGTGACIALEYLEPGGSLGAGVLPTGRPAEIIRLTDGREVLASIVDATNPMVFVPAAAVGLTGVEPPAAIDGDRALVASLEEIRAQAAVRVGLARDPAEAAERVRAIPKVAVVAGPSAYVTTGGESIRVDQVDLVARMLSMGRAHRTFALTAAMCLAVAAAIEGTVVHAVARRPDGVRAQLRLGHAAGILPIAAEVECGRGGWHVHRITTYRTARRIMDGFVYVPSSRLGS